MTSPSLLEEELPALYSMYYPRKDVDTRELLKTASRVAGVAARLRRWWEGTNCQGQYSVRPGQSMLDVGCGTGLSLLEARHLGSQAFGIEADPNVRPIAEELGLRIHIGSLYDCPFPDLRFDLIVLNQVIEHIPQPGKMLAALRDRLNPGGRIVLAFPNRASFWRRLSRRRWINWHIPYHLHHFDSRSFESLARHHGYRVAHRQTITPNLWTTLQLRALRESRERGTPSPLWMAATSTVKGDAPVRNFARFAPVRVARALLRRAAVLGRGLMNRVIDVVGYGDSLMVELIIEERA
jgi:SAM-dependent methyltransferase